VFPAGIQTNSVTLAVLPDTDRTANVSALIRGGEIVVNAARIPGDPGVRDGGGLELIDDEPGVEVVKEGAYGVSYGKMKSYGFRDCIAVAVRDASGKGVLLHLSPGTDIAYMMNKVWAEFGLKRKDARLRDLEISVAAGFYFRQTNILSDLGAVLRAHGAVLSEQNKFISDDDVRNILFDPSSGKMYELRNILDGGKPAGKTKKVRDWLVGVFINAPDTLTRDQARLEQVQFELTLETAVRTGLVLKPEYVYRAPFRVITGHTLTFEVSNLDQLINELARNAYDGYASFFDPDLAAAGLRKPSSSTRGLINIVVSKSRDAYVIEIRDNGADSRGADSAHKGVSLVRVMFDPDKNKPFLYFGRMGVFEKILNGDAETGSEGVLKYLWNKSGGVPEGAIYEKIPGKDGMGMTVRIRIPLQAVEEAKPGVLVPTAFAVDVPAEAESPKSDARDGGKKLPADIKSVPDPADISFLIADLKLLPDGSIKILEFGRGMHSGFEGYEALYGENGIMSQFWDRLAALGLPIRYTISVMTLGFGGEQFVHDRAVRKLDRLPGSKCTLFASFLHELETGAFGAKKPDFDPRDLSTYSGILVYGGSEYGDDEILEIMKAYPWILVIDGRANTVDLYAGDKFLTNTLFEGDLARYRPGWKMFPKQYRRDLADSIRRDMPAQRYVIKPLEASRGRGVLVVESDALDDVLKKILTRDNAAEKARVKMEEFRIVDGEDDPYEYWVIDKNPVFLIETCEASKPVRANGEQYDGTMRMVFTLTRNKGDTSIDFIDAYWKLPSRPLGQGPSRDSVVSKIHREEDADLGAPISAPVSNRDKAIVEEQLKGIIPGIYQRIISETPDAVMRRLINSVDESHRAYGLYLLSRTANIPVDLAVEAQKAAAERNGLYDAILADLIGRRYDWKKNSNLIPLAGVLMGSHDAAVRDEMIQCALNNKKLKPFRELLLDHADLWETAKRPETRARYASFLYERRRINARELLARYEKLFAAGDYDTRKFIVRDLVAKNRVLRAAWLAPYLQDKESLLFALWYNVLEENKEKMQKAAFAAKDDGSLGRYLRYRQDVETLTDDQVVKLLRIASVNQKLKLCEWYKEIIKERSTMTRSIPLRRLYAVLDWYFHATQTIFESFQATTEACDEYIYNTGKDGGNDPYRFKDAALSVADDGTVSMQRSGKKYVVSAHGQWYAVMNTAQTIMRAMNAVEMEDMLSAMKVYVSAGGVRARDMQELINAGKELLREAESVRPAAQEAVKETGGFEPEEASERPKPQPIVEIPFNSQKPFLNLWGKYNFKKTQGASYDSLELNPENIRGFKAALTEQIRDTGKAALVKQVSSRNEANVSPNLVWLFLRIVFSPDEKQLKLLDAIYTADEDNVLTVAALREASGINANNIRNYLRMFEKMGVVRMAFVGRENVVTAVNKDMFHAWFGQDAKDGGGRAVGGVDLRALVSAGAKARSKALASKPVRPVNEAELRSQWGNICGDLAAGRMPYDTLRDYVDQCSAQNAQKELMAAVDYIAEILRAEECYGIATPQELRAILEKFPI